MTNEILQGKSDTVNTLIRSDEGEVASAKPRRRLSRHAVKTVFCLLSFFLVTVSVAGNYAWQGPADDVISSGAWGQESNWLVGSVRAKQVPGIDDVAQFVGNMSPIVSFNNNYTVSSIVIPDGNTPEVMFDLGGYAFSVTNAVRIQKTWDSDACFAFTNGQVTTRVASCGITTTEQWDWGGGRIIVQGPEAKLDVENKLSVIGKFSEFLVGCGAKASCNKFEGTTGQVGGVVEVSGVGSLFTVQNEFRLRDRFQMVVSNGGKVSVSVSSSDRVTIGRRRQTGCGAYMKVDNGTFEVTSGDVVVGDVDNGYVYHNSLVLTNGATMTVAGKVGLGCGHNGGKADTNTLAVCNGSTLIGSATSEVWSYGLNRGYDYWSHRNRIYVDGGEVSVMRMRIGNPGARPVSSNDVLFVSGNRAKIALSGTTADAFTLRMGSELRMTIPESGFNVTPIQIPNGGATIVDDLDKGTKKTDFFLDAGVYSRKHKGRPLTLVECGVDSTKSLQLLVDNVTWVNTPEKLRGTLEVVDGKKLVYNPPPPQGLILFFR